MNRNFCQVGRVLCLGMLICLFSGCTVHGESFELELDDHWVMKTGDDPGWAVPDLDVSTWNPIKTGVVWEKAGFADYDGYAWYRIEFVIPQSYRQQIELRSKDHPVGPYLILAMGAIDDVDETFFNGVKIGSTGSMPPEYTTAYYTARKYRIPIERVKWDQKNVLAVRVFDGDGDGGMYQSPILIRLPGLSEIIDIRFDPENSNGIYFSPGPLPVRVEITNRSRQSYNLQLESILRTDEVFSDKVLESHSMEMQLEKGSVVSKTITFNPPGPGFYRVVCRVKEGGKTVFEKSMIFGYDPEEIRTELTRKKDFDAFWRKRKRDLSKVAPDFKVTRTDRSTSDLDVYLVEMRSYGDVLIRGWYTVPKSPGPHPAILSVPGYTTDMQPYMHRKNVATLALNPRGHGNSKDDVDPKGKELMYLDFDTAHPERYIYAGIFMDCIRAVDFLSSRSEIDPSRIGVEGGSQGGGLSFVTAALDRRIMFCAPDIAWLSDWGGSAITSPWAKENYPILMEEIDGLGFDDITVFLNYFDAMNMASRIKCPVLMSLGLQDMVCPPRTIFSTYNRVRSQKEYYVYPFTEHSVEREHDILKDKWMGKMLGVKF